MIPATDIAGVQILPLSTFPDPRGFFREICRTDHPFFAPRIAQLSHSLMYSGVIKAWHLHHLQTDWWYVGAGVIRLGLCDMRPGSATPRATAELLLGEHQPALCVRIPPGVAHGCQALQGPASLFYLQDRVFDPQDVVKLPHDHPDIDFDWTVKAAQG